MTGEAARLRAPSPVSDIFTLCSLVSAGSDWLIQTSVSPADSLWSLQALNGFVLVVTSDGSVFYSSSTIKDYLGFHQVRDSDVVHQSVFELIHTDDRAVFRQQLHFALNPPTAADGDGVSFMFSESFKVLYSPEKLPPENSSFLERSFVCRFRCLLDNSSGFLALKFQGRLKYLQGQRLLKGACTKAQLALFAIAMPVHTPSIVEIRTKTLLFQSKHKLDFTPMSIDSRGKVILGYSETELCMKGSGYQFIHAADMMHCADNHIRMIKTGESGLTVFRLLSKTGGWVWVKSNAKLIFKGGRPEFIIAYQKAIMNAEGEEYLRQRRLQLPFSFTTGEALFYNTGATMDIKEFQFNQMFGSDDVSKEGAPSSLLDCFLRQDEAAYSETIDPPVPVDQVFMDTHALVSVPSDGWRDSRPVASTENPVVVKEEAKQSEAELMELENTLKGLSQEDLQQNNMSSELDSILTNDIFDYIDNVLFKEKGEECLSGVPPACLSANNDHQRDLFPEVSGGLCDPLLFQAQSPDHTYDPLSGAYAHHQDVNTQRLSHLGPPSLRRRLPAPPSGSALPELTLPDPSAPFQSCGPASNGLMNFSHGVLPSPQNGFQNPPNRLFLQSSLKPPTRVAPSVTDAMPPLIPCNDFNSTPKIPLSFTTGCLQGSPPLGPLSQQVQQVQQVQQWPQQQTHLGVSVMQKAHEQMAACHSQTPETLPHAGLWQRGGAGLSHVQQGGLACGQAAAQSSCMFNQNFSSSPAGGAALSLAGSAGLRGVDGTLDQSPPQGSCYFQWSHSEPVVGTSAIDQKSVDISPLTAPPNTSSSSERALNIQHYLDRHRPAQVNMFHCELNNFS
uniref:Aryl hydrocarbon receptor-like n=1 Tax=Labrus bergylta TaxID=56723 RepID=A0A3Q3G0P8_9LABR